MEEAGYVHGYSDREARRLRDQASTLAELLHHDTRYPAGSRVLEIGCGVGAQTAILAARNPTSRFLAIDRSQESIARARTALARAGVRNVACVHADLYGLQAEPQSFDHVAICFVLEHLASPVEALRRAHRLLRPGGSLVVVEGDHGSVVFHPEGAAARAAIAAQVRLQRQDGGNALIGRELYALLREAGYVDVQVSPRIAYADAGRPAWIEGFTRRTFIPMVAAVRERAIMAGLIGAATFDEGIAQLQRTGAEDGMFGYTFFKAIARTPHVPGAPREPHSG